MDPIPSNFTIGQCTHYPTFDELPRNPVKNVIYHTIDEDLFFGWDREWYIFKFDNDDDEDEDEEDGTIIDDGFIKGQWIPIKNFLIKDR